MFSALIKDSYTRKIVFSYNHKFLFPEYVLEEAKKHRILLLQKSGLSEQEFEELLERILEKTEVVYNKKLDEKEKEALELVRGIDEDDALFVACALLYENSVLWSDDKRLKKVKKITVLNTKEISQALSEDLEETKKFYKDTA